MKADNARDIGLGAPRGCLFGFGVLIGMFLIILAVVFIIAN